MAAWAAASEGAVIMLAHQGLSSSCAADARCSAPLRKQLPTKAWKGFDQRAASSSEGAWVGA